MTILLHLCFDSVAERAGFVVFFVHGNQLTRQPYQPRGRRRTDIRSSRQRTVAVYRWPGGQRTDAGHGHDAQRVRTSDRRRILFDVPCVEIAGTARELLAADDAAASLKLRSSDVPVKSNTPISFVSCDVRPVPFRFLLYRYVKYRFFFFCFSAFPMTITTHICDNKYILIIIIYYDQVKRADLFVCRNNT